MRQADREYVRAVRHIVEHGTRKATRMSQDTISASGVQMRFNLERDGFPLLEFKSVPLRIVCVELAWFLSGRTNIKWLQERKVHIWDDDAAKAKERGFSYGAGELGPVYGRQWRAFGGVDQIENLLKLIREQPSSRRMIVSAWNPVDVPNMVLPPCHSFWQVVCDDDKHMDLLLTMRSGDFGLGLPFNIASYAVLLKLLASETGFVARELIITVNDAHVYTDHVEPLLERFASTAEESSGHPISVDLPQSISGFIEAHEGDVRFKPVVENYAPGPKLPLTLHT